MVLYQPPKNYKGRPVVVLGGGVLGRRIGIAPAFNPQRGILLTQLQLLALRLVDGQQGFETLLPPSEMLHWIISRKTLARILR